jgi:hypothetical protein
MSQQFPQPGDGIVTISGLRGIVRYRNTRDNSALRDNDPSTNPGDLVSIGADLYYGKSKRAFPTTLTPENYRQETFIEHLTRPSGFGKTPWQLFALIQGILLLGNVLWIISPEDYGITPAITSLVVNAVLVFGSYMNYKRRWL